MGKYGGILYAIRMDFLYMPVLLLFFGVTFAHDQETAPFKTAWLGEHETFVVWYAQKHGWDKEVGLDMSLIHFRFGRELWMEWSHMNGILPDAGCFGSDGSLKQSSFPMGSAMR